MEAVSDEVVDLFWGPARPADASLKASLSAAARFFDRLGGWAVDRSRKEQAGQYTRAGQEHSVPQNQPENIRWLSPQCHANSDFMGLLADHIGKQSVNPDGGEEKRDGGKTSYHG